MTERRFTLHVPGVPYPEGSKTAGVTKEGKPFLRDANDKKLRPWRKLIVTLAKRRITLSHGGSWSPLDCAVDVIADFYMARPANHYGTGRNSLVLKASAPEYPVAGGTKDVDKLARAALDALTTAGVFIDDVRVAHLDTWKRYADRQHPEGLELTVAPLTEVRTVETVVVQEALI